MLYRLVRPSEARSWSVFHAADLFRSCCCSSDFNEDFFNNCISTGAFLLLRVGYIGPKFPNFPMCLSRFFICRIWSVWSIEIYLLSKCMPTRRNSELVPNRVTILNFACLRNLIWVWLFSHITFIGELHWKNRSTETIITEKCNALNSELRREQFQMETQQRIPRNTSHKVKCAMDVFSLCLVQWRTRLDNDLKVSKDAEEFSKSDLDICSVFCWKKAEKCIPGQFQKYCMHDSLSIPNRTWLVIFLFQRSWIQKMKEFLWCPDEESCGGNIKPRKRALQHFQTRITAENSTYVRLIFACANTSRIDFFIWEFINCSLEAAQEHRDLEFGHNCQLT